MGDIDRTLQYHRLFGVFTDHRGGVDRIVIVERRRIELGAEQEDAVPVRHRHLGAHGAADGFSGHSHLVDLRHVPAGRIVTGSCGVVIQTAGICLDRRLLSRGDRYQIGNRLFAYRTAVHLGNQLLFLFLINNCAADQTFVNCHDNTSDYFCKFRSFSKHSGHKPSKTVRCRLI